MATVIEKCRVCAALIDGEDLFCANCGCASESETRPESESSKATHSFTCNGCGASMSYDASAQTLACPFCGSRKLTSEEGRNELLAKYVVPFAVSKGDVNQILQQWLSKDSFFRPADLLSQSVLTSAKPVFVPYWIFAANTFTYWTADSSDVPYSASGDWIPVSGEHRDAYSGILIGASATLTPAETNALCPFDLSAARAREDKNLNNYVVEQFRVKRKYARPLARQAIEHFEQQKCSRYVPGRVRNMRTNVRLEGINSVPVLLPVWVMAYQYKGKLFRFLINGQNGICSGEAPVSYRRAFILLLIALLVFMFLFALVAGANLFN